ncbi:MAG: hypothetical protein U5L09_19740 [Bacteroidales bacterium]|nr:hypothetical protein [Bacteroidales bacterium]
MSTFDLEGIWREDRDKAHRHYKSVEGALEDMAKKKSANILNKIHRKFVGEMIFSVVVVSLVGAGIFRFSRDMFIGYGVLIAGAFYMSLKLYLSLRRDIKKVNQQRVLESLEEYIRIIRLYIHRSKRFVYIVTPVAYVLGYVMALAESDITFTLQKVLIVLGSMIAFGVPLVWLMVWLTNKQYYRLMYEKHVVQLEAIRNRLKNGTGSEESQSVGS